VPKGKRVGRPTGSIGEATRRQILLITMKHIGEHGYAKATFNNIAAEAGLTSGAVYYYFKSKKALVVAVIAEVTSQLLERFERAATRADNLQSQLIAILEETIAVTDEMPYLAAFSVSVRVDGRRYPELARALAFSSGSYYDLYKRLIDEAVRRGGNRARRRPARRDGHVRDHQLRPDDAHGRAAGRSASRGYSNHREAAGRRPVRSPDSAAYE